MLDLDQARKDTEHNVTQAKEDSEYVRLVISSEPRTLDADILQPRSQSIIKSFKWWIKAIILCLITVVALLIFLKWGVPFLFEKVSTYSSLRIYISSSICFCTSSVVVVLSEI